MNYPNVVVLNVYLDVIKEALARLNFQCEYIKDFEGVSKQDLIVFPMGKDAFKYYFKGYRNFILWQQGATGAESYMRHSSKIRSGILNYIPACLNFSMTLSSINAPLERIVIKKPI